MFGELLDFRSTPEFVAPDRRKPVQLPASVRLRVIRVHGVSSVSAAAAIDPKAAVAQ
jgi:hypothetical protein